MELKIDTEYEGKLTFASKNDMKNLAIFHQSTKVALYVRLKGQYFFYKTYFKPKIHKTITSN